MPQSTKKSPMAAAAPAASHPVQCKSKTVGRGASFAAQEAESATQGRRLPQGSQAARTALVTYAVTLAGLVACAGSNSKPIEDGVTIRVAPLSLPDVSKVCYDLRVSNAAGGGGETVWSKGAPGLNNGTADADAICSNVFGNHGGGDITYVGPCDADGQEDPSDAAGERTNSVTLWFDGIYDGAGDYVDPSGPEGWQNPCKLPAGCTLDVLCEENADALVEFNFTVMRDANQGFFDVAVNFEDVFCSAKLDTCYGEGADARHIELLFGSDSERDWTAVFGFACSAGPGNSDTLLHYGALAVVCGGTVFPIDPTGAEGNHDVTVDGFTLNYGIYRGREQLDCDDVGTEQVESCNKLYWNLAFSLDDLTAVGPGCRLAFSATATDDGDGFSAGLPTAAGVSYPYVDVDATLTPAACHQYGVDDGVVVRTVYHGNVSGLLDPVAMCSQFDGAVAGPVAGACAAGQCPFSAGQVVSRFQSMFPPGAELDMDSGCYTESGEQETVVYFLAASIDGWNTYAAYTYGYVDPDWQYQVGIEDEQYGTDYSSSEPTDYAGYLACASEVTAACGLIGWQMNVPYGCGSDAACPDQVCDPVSRECVNCVADCAAAGQICDNVIHQCVDCLSSADCGVGSCTTDTFCVCESDQTCQAHEPAIAIASSNAGQATCSRTAAGRVKCVSGFGESKVPAPSGPAVSHSVGGESNASTGCAALATGTVECWKTGTGGFVPVVSVVGGLTAAAIAVTSGQRHDCALLADGAVMCWGANGSAQLGDGTFVDSPDVAVNVNGLGSGSGVVAIDAGGDYTCALRDTGTVACWGDNTGPTNVSGISNATAVRAGRPFGAQSCALQGGDVYCWNHGAAAYQVAGLPAGTITSIDVGNTHSCAVAGGEPWCWGFNGNGQVDPAQAGGVNLPPTRPFVGLTASAVSAGTAHSCALLTTGVVWCWGFNAGSGTEFREL